MKKEQIKNAVSQMKNNAKKRDWSWVFILLFGLILAGVVFSPMGQRMTADAEQKAAMQGAENAVKEMTFSALMSSEIATMDIHEDMATGTLKDGTKYKSVIVYDPELLQKISASGAVVKIDNSRGLGYYLGTWLPIIFAVILILWILRGFRSGGGIPRASSFNPTKIISGKTKTTFADVAGIESEKKEVSEIVDFLKNPKKFKDLGARVPRGVLLSGEPGTGKTLLARAIAGEANVPFFATSGSDFSGIIMGLGVAKIKEIFEMAKRNAPCILFIDEIDAIGQRRRNGFNDQDREQTLNQLLIEMDGFQNENGVIVIGATNRPDMLDTALLRPGRFDRQVRIELPNMQGRTEILNLYAKKFKLAKNVSIDEIARGTTGFSGADLENLLNEAALHAAGENHKVVEKTDIEEARDKTLMGQKTNRKMNDLDKKLTAYHEAGHAFVSVHYRDLIDPIHKATIIPRGRALGMVQHLPIDDKVSMTLAEIRANLSVSLAGRAAEEIFFGSDKITTGAESDIAGATRLTRVAITIAGLSKRVGPIAINQATTFGGRSALENASEKTAELVDAEIKSWMEAAQKDAIKILTAGKAKVEKLADELLKRETLTREEIEKIIGVKPKPAPKKTAKK
ncbi:MAG: ATP-dependent zinc metalloprotease FtsH [Rickettsiales bacterium]|jgi:cell division protease FtsH|nr:ATP-dependent zinc metalloprotease FtsH [Rickettsiales bacterium]